MKKNYVTAIIPAHNEALVIKDCITSLITNGCDEIIVANDNSSDETYKICLESNVTVFNTVNNKGRKAGAINQALKNYLNPIVDSYNHYI
ncbi:glycosyltransferase, partial [Levilactobacillus brevis]